MVTAAICRPRTEICQINDEHRRVMGTTSPASSVRGLLPKSVSMMSPQNQELLYDMITVGSVKIMGLPFN
jgi:hypothetical protein